MDMYYDVAVVGAGPAGALTAYYLAEKGFKVVLLERKALPRYKACGGGLTARAMAELPFTVSPVVEDRIYRPKMLYQDRLLFEAQRTRPLITMVMRDVFDAYLVERAVEKGAVLRDATAFKSVSGPAGDLSVQTDRDSIKTRLIVGADGYPGRVGRCLGLTVRCARMTAVEGECRFANPNVIARFRQSVHFDFGVIPKGYGWVFPKRDHLSVGVVTLGTNNVRGVTAAFHAYMRCKHLDCASRIHPLRGRMIPFAPVWRKNRLATDRGLVVGDATAVTDPLTGEGLYFAIKGADLAARALCLALDRGYDYLPRYTGRVASAFKADLVCARRMARAIYELPFLGRWLLMTRGEKLSRRQIAVVSGETSYQDVFRRLFSTVLKGDFV